MNRKQRRAAKKVKPQVSGAAASRKLSAAETFAVAVAQHKASNLQAAADSSTLPCSLSRTPRL